MTVKSVNKKFIELALHVDLEDHRDKLVLIILSANCRSGKIRSKYEPLAEQCCMKKGVFSRSLSNLKKMGLVSTRKVHNEDGLLDHYIFNINL